MLMNMPCTYGYNLKEQSAVRSHLLAAKPDADFELVGDFPGFDLGKIQDRGTEKSRFLTGLRSWEMRFAFPVVPFAFETDDLDATISLVMAQAYVTFKKVVFEKEEFWSYETIPSGTYWAYLFDSVICDLRVELVAIPLGDPASCRVVGGDDSYSMLRVNQTSLEMSTTSSKKHQQQLRNFL